MSKLFLMDRQAAILIGGHYRLAKIYAQKSDEPLLYEVFLDEITPPNVVKEILYSKSRVYSLDPFLIEVKREHYKLYPHRINLTHEKNGVYLGYSNGSKERYSYIVLNGMLFVSGSGGWIHYQHGALEQTVLEGYKFFHITPENALSEFPLSLKEKLIQHVKEIEDV